MKTIYKMLTPAILMLAAACGQPPKGNQMASDKPAPDTIIKKAVSPKLLIIPGSGIGQIGLKESTDSVINTLGKPDKSDAAMGASMMSWYAGHDTADYVVTVYAHHNMGGADEMKAHVKQIRITSPDFQTAEGLHTSSMLKEISQHYHIKPHAIPGLGRGKLYDDNDAGIAFEIDDHTQCDAIIVHIPKDSLATYLNMR